MDRLARTIEREGYPIWVRSYPSQVLSIEASAAEIASELAQRFSKQPLALVTHSLGGIVARYVAGPFGDALNIERILMLAPPNRGSRLARRLGAFRAFRRIYGPAGQQLRAADENAWPEPKVPVAVIAGTRAGGLNPTGWLSRATGLILRSEASDGTVLTEETHYPGMVDFATVNASHTFIMDHPRVHQMTLTFLREGKLRP
jgi:pimeloyl-ACP methyl ester carboxylesterase